MELANRLECLDNGMQLLLNTAALFLGLLMCVSMVTLRFTLDRRVRQALPKDKVYDKYPDWYFGIGRAISFGSAAIFTRAGKSEYMQNYYNGFDVKAFSNIFEKSVALIMVLSLVLMLVALFVDQVCVWLGFWYYEN